MKVKCDGVLPCARCSKNSLLCSFSSGKKKPSLSNEGFSSSSSSSLFILFLFSIIKN